MYAVMCALCTSVSSVGLCACVLSVGASRGCDLSFNASSGFFECIFAASVSLTSVLSFGLTSSDLRGSTLTVGLSCEGVLSFGMR